MSIFWRRIEDLVMIGVVCMAVAWMLMILGGCGVANPKTQFSVNPITKTITFSDTKDNTLEIEDLEFVSANGSGASIKRLSLRNNASDVRIANVEQLKEVTMQLKQLGENFNQGMLAIGQAVSQIGNTFVPSGLFGGAGMYGGGVPNFARPSIRSPQSIAAMVKFYQAYLEAQAVVVPTTQPVE